MNRHQRRKRALLRKADKLRLLANRAVQLRNREITAKALSDPTTRNVERSPKGLGNRGIYQGVGMFQAPGYGSGMFKRDDTAFSDAGLKHWKAGIEKRANKNR